MHYLYCLIAATAVVSLGACTTAAPTAPTEAPTMALLASPLAAEWFQPAFYRAFVQNAYESPGQLAPVRRLPGPLRLYIRTHDDRGRAIDSFTLDATERVLVATTTIWAGDTFGVTEVVRGTGSREKVGGWITVKWSSVAAAGRCGESTVGVDGGFIQFNDLGPCSCGFATRVYPRLVRHELGHAMGYYHTDHADDVMYGRAITPDSCDLEPSERERRHARYAYDSHR